MKKDPRPRNPRLKDPRLEEALEKMHKRHIGVAAMMRRLRGLDADTVDHYLTAMDIVEKSGRFYPHHLIIVLEDGLKKKHFNAQTLKLMGPIVRTAAENGYDPQSLPIFIDSAIHYRTLNNRRLASIAPMLHVVTKAGINPLHLFKPLEAGLESGAIRPQKLKSSAEALAVELPGKDSEEELAVLAGLIEAGLRGAGITDRDLRYSGKSLEARLPRGRNGRILLTHLFQHKLVTPENLETAIDQAGRSFGPFREDSDHDISGLLVRGLKSGAFEMGSLSDSAESIHNLVSRAPERFSHNKLMGQLGPLIDSKTVRGKRLFDFPDELTAPYASVVALEALGNGKFDKAGLDGQTRRLSRLMHSAGHLDKVKDLTADLTRLAEPDAMHKPSFLRLLEHLDKHRAHGPLRLLEHAYDAADELGISFPEVIAHQEKFFNKGHFPTVTEVVDYHRRVVEKREGRKKR